ncbi:MAG: outer membrane lipoprotein chaperone LolA [Bryobacteraceae bacterium]|nr:outer membrane lipoprotein chaperone LolA [Bryobacteraceae bacterium]
MIAFLLALSIAPETIERRYNATRTLIVEFTQVYEGAGRARAESGTLTLLKPGRMRWDYGGGKVFVADGKTLWFYVPNANRAERSKVKESDDLRAPLAFLLGRLDFSRDFRQLRDEGGEIVAIPKSDKAPYREVRFVAAGDGRIERVTVTGQDASVMRFEFSNERRNVAVDPQFFRFTPPPGTEIVEAER